MPKVIGFVRDPREFLMRCETGEGHLFLAPPGLGIKSLVGNHSSETFRMVQYKDTPVTVSERWPVVDA